MYRGSEPGEHLNRTRRRVEADGRNVAVSRQQLRKYHLRGHQLKVG
jgi:hypothetical protein